MKTRRVVVTGMGIVSCIGNDCDTVLNSLKNGKSGLKFQEKYQEVGMRSHVAGSIDIDTEALIDRHDRRFMGNAAAYAHIAMSQAIKDAGLSAEEISHPKVGLIAGSGGASSSDQVNAADILRSKGIRRVGPYQVTKTMGSTVSACLATSFKIKGLNYSISSACSTSAHCIGAAMEQIQMGKQDIVFAGGGEEEHWTLSMLFDAMGALSSRYNECPEKASRPYDANRDGFVIAGGGGMLVLEELEHAQKRGAKIYAELIGFGANSDGANMVAPSGEGAVRCMKIALDMASSHEASGQSQPISIDYLNTHGTSTPAGDIPELNAVREVFGENTPPLSSTKSMTGHSLGATGVQEAIYSLLMLTHDFIAPSINIEQLDTGAEGFNIVTQLREKLNLKTIMSNNFGFGGTNASLIFRKL
jgi:3-oxoacyl-[acyl-carrier-protein] synthase-1